MQFLFKIESGVNYRSPLTGGGTLQTGRCCPLKTTEHAGTCCALQAGMCWPVQSGMPCGATVVIVYETGTWP